MKGIVLAGGSSTRLYPLTQAFSKQLLPVYDKPLIYYPIATLMLAGIREMLIITRPDDRPLLEQYLGSGEQWGITLHFAEQPEPRGVADALRIGTEFFPDERVALILGDNIFFGHGLAALLDEAVSHESGACVLAYWVPDPERFGVIEFDEQENPFSIEEKPQIPRSNYAVTGLYFYDQNALDYCRNLQPSHRNELEITDVNNRYLEKGMLHAIRLQRGFAWIDAGTPDALLEAANYVHIIERRQGLKIACVEEIAWRQGWIDSEALEALSAVAPTSDYGKYLLDLVNGIR